MKQRKIQRRPIVRERVGLSDSTIDRKERTGEFPTRVKLGSNSIGWYADEIDDYLNSLERGGPGPPKRANEARWITASAEARIAHGSHACE